MILKAAHWFCVNVSFETASQRAVLIPQYGPFPGTVKLREGSLTALLVTSGVDFGRRMFDLRHGLPN